MRAKAKEMGEEITKNLQERLKSRTASQDKNAEAEARDDQTNGIKGVDENDKRF